MALQKSWSHQGMTFPQSYWVIAKLETRKNMVDREDPALAIAPQGSPAEEKEYKEGTWVGISLWGFLFANIQMHNLKPPMASHSMLPL